MYVGTSHVVGKKIFSDVLNNKLKKEKPIWALCLAVEHKTELKTNVTLLNLLDIIGVIAVV